MRSKARALGSLLLLAAAPLCAQEDNGPPLGIAVHPPAVFTVVPASTASVRFVAFGDFGFDSPGQTGVATQIVEYGKTHPYTFGITVGDNFYIDDVLSGTADPRWQSIWEAHYSMLHIPVYAVLGNHDWRRKDVEAEEAYHSETWHMPEQYYTFVAGPVQFFGINTNIPRDSAQQHWLVRALKASTAKWKVVYGHHPLYVPTDTTGYANSVLDALIKPYVDVYLCGHRHVLSFYMPPHQFPTFVTGGGGGHEASEPVTDTTSTAAVPFLSDRGGFIAVEASASRFAVTYVYPDGTIPYTHTLTK